MHPDVVVVVVVVVVVIVVVFVVVIVVVVVCLECQADSDCKSNLISASPAIAIEMT